MERDSQTIPVRIYQGPEQIILATPMPGLEAGDISVAIADQRVTITGKERGPGQHERDLLVNEWTIGPYFREIDLDQPVNGPLTNATYGNGVLVLSMPKSKDGQRGSNVTFELSRIESTRGERIGYRGSDVTPVSENEPRQERNNK